jgi:nucleotide-binding universal stress UspA family protein
MTYRSILVHLDESPRCTVRVDIAARLARVHGAHLHGLAPAGRVNLPAQVTPSLVGVPNYMALAQAGLNERAAALVDAFGQRADAAGLDAFDGRVVEDDSVHALVEQAHVHDLVVLGQTDRGSPASSMEVNIPEQVFMQSGTPTLVVPYVGAFDTVGECVIVAWNATRESARAVRDALPLLRAARRVHLLCFGATRDLHHVSRRQLDDARRWLARHGIEAVLHQEPVQAKVGEVLLSRACDLGADLLVMGGYSHSRVLEFVIGGVTRRLLADMTVPVLMSH